MIELRPLTEADIDAHNAGEDEETVRRLTGGWGTTESTRRHFAMLAENAARGAGKRGFGVWLDGRLAGYIDYDPELADLPETGDVNISYAVHPWARRHSVATGAVGLLCERLAAEGATRAVIRTEQDNLASVGVAQRAGFTFEALTVSATDRHADGTPIEYAVYTRALRA